MRYGVIVADDQGIARKYFETVIGAASDLRVLYSLPSLASVPAYCAGQRVDLVIMEAAFSDGTSGIDMVASLKTLSPPTKILIVSSTPARYLLEKARAAGADGFWRKDSAEPELKGVVRTLVKGGQFWPTDLPDVRIGDASLSELTGAETDVLMAISTGASNRMIAESLGIEIGTVKSHINHLLRKTGLSNRTSLAIEARVKGVAAGAVVRGLRDEREA